MTDARRLLLRANALFLVAAALGGLRSDLVGAFLGQGPIAIALGSAPHAAIGFVEAHGLALILGALLWRAQPSRLWHATGAAIHALLGASNLVFWPVFGATGMQAVGYVTTAVHGTFFALQLIAALSFARTSTATVDPAAHSSTPTKA